MLREEIIEYLKPLYPDITPETMDSIPLERRKQYERDIATISENYEEFSSYFSENQDVKQSLCEIKSQKYMNIVFPGFKQMSPARQQKCNDRFDSCRHNITELDIIFGKLTDPEDPLYNPNISEEEAVKIASIYANAYESSNGDVLYETGNVLHDSEDWYKPVYEKKSRKPTDGEQQVFMRFAISEYTHKNQFIYKMKNILIGLKNYKINTQDALAVRDHLKKALSPVQTQTDKNKTEEENSL